MAQRKYMVRVIAGGLKGRLLQYPATADVRPTMQRTKSSIFESLGPRIVKSVFADVYAGAGAIGIEALSRGARLAHFVERSRVTVDFLRRNLDTCGIPPDRYRVHFADALDFLERTLPSLGADVIHVDPPYDDTDFAVLLELLGRIGYSADKRVVIEHPRGVVLAPPRGLALTKTRRFGQTCVSFFAGAGGEES